MALQECGFNINNTNKELRPHGTAEFPCAGYESRHTSSIEDVIPWHWHEELEMIHVIKGTMKLQVLSEHLTVHEGELAVINANTLHSASGDPYCELQSLVFSPLLVTGSTNLIFAVKYVSPLIACGKFSCVLFGKKNRRVSRWFTFAFQALRTDVFGYEFIVRDQLTHILLSVYEKLEDAILKSDSTKSMDEIRLGEMLDYIHSNFTKNITLADIAGVSGISEREALRCFKRTIGESPIQYLLKHRLMQSAYMLLTDPTASIASIAGNCGFDSPAYYAKKFKELYHCAPRDYRQHILSQIGDM